MSVEAPESSFGGLQEIGGGEVVLLPRVPQALWVVLEGAVELLSLSSTMA